ncbi:class I SAM-dependent methyltransferase [Candidatus Pacearchaeota archaeon]|nr:class I SAM-dependent methyltransferase [Candidatus Pacearchaeota archaeon]
MKKSRHDTLEAGKSGSTERFGYEWDTYSDIIPEYEGQFLKWVYPLGKNDFKGKKILDGGCGIGRNSFWPLKYGAKKALAFDYDPRTVEAAKKNLSQFNEAKVRWGSIYEIPEKGQFDISFSVGVIHHLADPRKAVSELAKATKKGGKVLIWVYGYEGNEWIVRYINPIRKITSKLPLKFVHILSYCLSIPLYSYVKLFSPKHPYLNQLSRFRLWHTHSIVFDQLIPRIANYWKRDEARGLFENQGLKDINVYRVNGNSWTVIGTKK